MAAGLLLLVIGGAVLLLRRPLRPVATLDSFVEPPAGAPSAGARRSVRELDPSRVIIRRRDGRIPIPRLRAVAPPAGDDGPATVRLPTPNLERGHGQLFDRRADPGPDSETLRLHLRDRLRAVDEAVEACLARHVGQDPSLAAGVMLAFNLDASGLQEVWIEEHEQITAGPLTCLSEAVYGVDWIGLTRDPIKVSRRMRTRPGADSTK